MHGGHELFLCTIQWWHPNECSNKNCSQITDDKMLKFLKEVKRKKKILKSAILQLLNFDPNVNFQENATSNFHKTFKNKYFELIYIYLDTKFNATCN